MTSRRNKNLFYFTSCCAGTALLAFSLEPGRADAAGFALKEQSASLQGSSFAGASSSASAPGTLFFNPASIGRMDGYQISLNINYIAPMGEVNDATSTNTLNPPIAAQAPQNLADVSTDEFVPAIYGTAKINNQLAVGLGISVPFGLETDYPNDWAGRYHGVKSRLLSVNFNPVVAYTPIPQVSIAAGLQVQYIEAELTNAVDFATIAQAAPSGTLDGFAQVEGDDVDYGFTLGALVEPIEGTSIGVGYRSKIDHNLRGDADFTVPAALANTAIGALFTDTSATAAVELPAMLNIGITQKITDQLTIMGEAQWTQWSSFDELVIKFDNNVPNNVTEEEWNDQWFFAVGASYDVNEKWTVRTGVAYDQKPLQGTFRTPRIPDNDRYWVSAGVTYSPTPWASIDLGYSHIFVEESDIRLRTDDPGNASRGDLDAEVEGGVDILALAARFKF